MAVNNYISIDVVDTAVVCNLDIKQGTLNNDEVQARCPYCHDSKYRMYLSHRMKDFMKLVAACRADLDSIGIRCGTVRNWEINTRARCRWGQCKQIAKGVFDISIAQRLLEDEVDDQAAKDTIVHELLHTVPGAFDHQGKWKALAQAVNTKLPGYHIKRTTSVDEKGIQAAPKERPYRYELRCEGCGSIIRRERESNLVKHLEHYRCAHCGGKVKRIL